MKPKWHGLDIFKREGRLVERYVCLNQNCFLHCRVFVRLGEEPIKCLEEGKNETISQTSIQMA